MVGGAGSGELCSAVWSRTLHPVTAGVSERPRSDGQRKCRMVDRTDQRVYLHSARLAPRVRQPQSRASGTNTLPDVLLPGAVTPGAWIQDGRRGLPSEIEMDAQR